MATATFGTEASIAEENWLLRDEVEALRYEIADLKAQLADAELREAALLSAEVKMAIAAIQHPLGTYSDAQLLTSICRGWLRTYKHDRKVCEAVKRSNHAGLEYLAVECDWADLLTRYGAIEAAELVQQLATLRDEREVAQAVEEWTNPDLSDLS